MTMQNKLNDSLMKLSFIKTGLQIRINRKHRGLTIRQLAKLVKITSQAMCAIERGNLYKVKINTLTKIANAFDCAYQIKFISTIEQVKQVSQEPQIICSFEEENKHVRFK